MTVDRDINDTFRKAFLSFIYYNMLKLVSRSFSTSCKRGALFDANSPLRVVKPLQAYAPTFYTHGENIKPLYEPAQFYSQLKKSILSAKERIFIAALYIGQSEQELVIIRNIMHRQRQLTLT